MTELLENPVIKDQEISDDAFLEAATLADKGEDIPADLISAKPAEPRAAEPEPVTEPSAKPDNSEAETEKKERPRDELGRFTKTEEGVEIPESERKPAEVVKPESQYTKATKERERQENLLKNFQQEKDTFRAESERIRQQLQREAQELQQAREQRVAPNVSQAGQVRYSSGELVQAADEFEAKAAKAFETGDQEAFTESLKWAREARQQAGQVYQLEQQAAQQQQTQRFQTVYQQVMDKAIQAEPELAKADTPLSKDVQALLEQEPVFSHVPDGFAKAVQVAKWKRDAGSASELRETNKKLQAEIDRLTGLTQLNGSGPTSPPAQKSFETMSEAEKDEYLLRQAQKIDSANN